MMAKNNPGKLAALFLTVPAAAAMAAEDSNSAASAPALTGSNDVSVATIQKPAEAPEQNWNWHAQNTDIVQYHPGFHAKYTGPNSLSPANEVRETVSVDLLAGARLWQGAEFHVDGLMWQGFGLSKTLGVEAFPNAEGFRLGTKVPNVVFSRIFVRQTIGLGGEEETVADDELHLAGKQDISRITLTLGKFSAKDLFDNNAYANDPRTQFMNWGLVANEAWDYPADTLGFITGFAAELNQPQWTARYGFFQVPRSSNGSAEDPAYLRAWAMVTEFEHRHTLGGHPGAVRVLAYVNRAHMGSYQATVDNPALGGDITRTREYRHKFGLGLNVEQELMKGIGAFARAGWSDGRNEAWMYSDVDYAVTGGLSINGDFWHRANDTLGVAGIANGISRSHRDFLAAGGTGILAGDGALNYGWETALETYYDFEIWKTIHGAVDYQFINSPAFNRDRGPVSVFGARLHWEF